MLTAKLRPDYFRTDCLQALPATEAPVLSTTLRTPCESHNTQCPSCQALTQLCQPDIGYSVSASQTATSPAAEDPPPFVVVQHVLHGAMVTLKLLLLVHPVRAKPPAKEHISLASVMQKLVSELQSANRTLAGCHLQRAEETDIAAAVKAFAQLTAQLMALPLDPAPHSNPGQDTSLLDVVENAMHAFSGGSAHLQSTAVAGFFKSEIAGALMTCLDHGGRHSQVACSLIEMLFEVESPVIQMQSLQLQLLDMQLVPTLATLLQTWCTTGEQQTQKTVSKASEPSNAGHQQSQPSQKGIPELQQIAKLIQTVISSQLQSKPKPSTYSIQTRPDVASHVLQLHSEALSAPDQSEHTLKLQSVLTTPTSSHSQTYHTSLVPDLGSDAPLPGHRAAEQAQPGDAVTLLTHLVNTDSCQVAKQLLHQHWPTPSAAEW